MSAILEKARGATAFTRLEQESVPFVSANAVTYQPVDHVQSTGWAERGVDVLLQIRQLEDDWDGEGSAAPCKALVDFAIRWAKRQEASGWPAPGRVHASVNATIYFEWRSPAGYLEVEIVQPGVAEGRFVSQGSNTATAVHVG